MTLLASGSQTSQSNMRGITDQLNEYGKRSRDQAEESHEQQKRQCKELHNSIRQIGKKQSAHRAELGESLERSQLAVLSRMDRTQEALSRIQSCLDSSFQSNSVALELILESIKGLDR